jgi:acetoin utilization protein AcuB
MIQIMRGRVPHGTLEARATMGTWSERIGTVGDWMTPNPTTVSPETSIGEVAHLMRTQGIRHVLVLDGEILVGIASNRDVRGRSLEQPSDLSARSPIAKVMTEAPITVSVETPLTEAARAMLDRKIGALPVTDDLRLVGILTKADALEALLAWAEREPGAPP